jgi:formylglycine-generating enzyme required for sulfatase activity
MRRLPLEALDSEERRNLEEFLRASDVNAPPRVGERRSRAPRWIVPVQMDRIMYQLLPLEAVRGGGSSAWPVETGHVELLRFVPTHARSGASRQVLLDRQRFRGLILVGDVRHADGQAAGHDDLFKEIDGVAQAMRQADLEFQVASVRGNLGRGAWPERAILGASGRDDAPFLDDLAALLRDERPDILHFVGHSGLLPLEGAQGDQAPSYRPDQQAAGLRFAIGPLHTDGVVISAEDLAANIDPDRTRIVIVNACYGGPLLGHALCQAADHVILMGAKLGTGVAALWATALYRNLLVDGMRIGRAVAEARESLGNDKAWLPQHYARSLHDDAFVRNRWRRWLDDRVKELHDLEGAHVARFGLMSDVLQRLYLDVPLTPEQHPSGLEQRKGGYTLEALLSLRGNQMPGYTGRWFLFGDAGTGKSTSLRWAARRLAEQHLALPVYIKLPDWLSTDDRKAYWDELVGNRLTEQDHADLVVLLDGLDEVEGSREDVRNEIRTLMRDGGPIPAAATVVVTSRYSLDRSLLSGDFVPCRLRPLSHDACRVLARQWFSLAGAEGPEQAAEKLCRELERSMPQEAGIPLFIHLAAQLQLEGESLERLDRIELCRKCVQSLIRASHRTLVDPLDPAPKTSGIPDSVVIWAARWLAFESLVLGRDFLQGLEETTTLADWINRNKKRPLIARFFDFLRATKVRGLMTPQSAMQEKRALLARFADACSLRGHINAATDLRLGDVIRHIARGGLLQLESKSMRFNWRHASLADALVAELLLAISSGRSELVRDLAKTQGFDASNLAESSALVALGLQKTPEKPSAYIDWVQFLVRIDLAGHLEGRLALPVLATGSTVEPSLVASILRTTKNPISRVKFFEACSFDRVDSIQAFLQALIQSSSQVDPPRRRYQDLGYALCCARSMSHNEKGKHMSTCIETAILALLPVPSNDALMLIFGTIGGSWISPEFGAKERRDKWVAAAMAWVLRKEKAGPDVANAFLAASAVLRDPEVLQVVADAPMNTPFWTWIEGNVGAAEPFAVGADPEDDLAYETEISPLGGVRISSFWISAVLVTRGLYRHFDSSHPTNAQGDPDEPATDLSWYEARLFCAWATHYLRLHGQIANDEIIDLPTEYQWEYAARERGGSVGGSRFHTGRDQEALNRAGWNFDEQGGRITMPVGLLRPAHPERTSGELRGGLWDFHGNVWEYCRNVWTKRLEAGVDPTMHDTQTFRSFDFRAIRGGACKAPARHCRASYRDRGVPPFVFTGDLGFRIVRSTMSEATNRDSQGPDPESLREFE